MSPGQAPSGGARMSHPPTDEAAKPPDPGHDQARGGGAAGRNPRGTSAQMT